MNENQINRFDFGRRSVLNADEANWFLDLQGFPRAHRTHRLIEADGQLIAQYESHCGSTIPHATAAFVIVEPDEIVHSRSTEVATPALDAGELLFLAQAFADRQPEGNDVRSLREHRTLVSDAVACVDSALQRIPKGVDEVPVDSILSTEGRRILAEEPGRFRRDRLNAYRSGLAQELARIDTTIDRAVAHRDAEKSTSSEPTPAPRTETESVIAAVAAMEVIREQAMPLLETIRCDVSGQIVAGLQPRDADYEKVFVGTMVEQARVRYRELWARGIQMSYPSSRQTIIGCAVAPAGMLDHANELSRKFPGGYAAIAAGLNPHRIWIAWKYLEPGAQSGLSFDGLVWVDDHWAWFPKPYRILRHRRG